MNGVSLQKPVIAPKPCIPRPQSASPKPRDPPPPPPAAAAAAAATVAPDDRVRSISLAATQQPPPPDHRPRTLPIVPDQANDSSLSSSTSGQHAESPEKLSLKARLKLFEKEIEQQGKVPKPKAGRGE